MSRPPSTNRRMSSQQHQQLQSSQGLGEEDRRFAELLKPIKDLTANWNVPLAEYLQDYYQEISEIHINLDGKTTRVNFAEAALFLQGTACVYSKKVEFLWQTVLGMLDTLASKRALEEAAGDGSATGGEKSNKRRKGGQLFDPNNFSLIHLELTRNADLKTDFATSTAGSGLVSGTDSAGGNAGNRKDVHSRKMTLKFIFVTPRQLIEKEGKEVKETRVNLYVPVVGSSGSGSESTELSYDLIGHKEDFRVNMQFSMKTGMIGEELAHDTELGQQSVSLCDNNDVTKDSSFSVASFCDDVTAANNQDDVIGTHDAEEQGALNNHDIDDNIGNADNGGGDDVTGNADDIEAPPQPDSNDVIEGEKTVIQVVQDEVKEKQGEETTGRKRPRDKLAEICNEPKAPLADPWEPITPQEAAATTAAAAAARAHKAKPARRGKTARIPANLDPQVFKNKNLRNQRNLKKQQRQIESGSNQADDKLRVSVPVEYFLIQELSGGKYSGKDILFNENVATGGNGHTAAKDPPPEFKDLKKKRGSTRRQQSEEAEMTSQKPDDDVEKEQIKSSEEAAAAAAAQPEEGGEEGGGGDNDDDGDPFDAGFPDPHAANDFDLMASPPVEDEAPAAAMAGEEGESGAVAEAAAGTTDSYEELVIKRVAAYVAQSQDYIESTDLAKRVNRWHQSIGPRLERVEKRGNFDIHRYGTRILEQFPAAAGNDDDNDETSRQKQAKTTLRFADVVQGQEKEEVARFFLSSLMLANTYNIDLRSASGLDLAMDDAEMTLLSTTRHHEKMFQSRGKKQHRRGGKKPAGKNSVSSSDDAESSNSDSSSDEDNLGVTKFPPVPKRVVKPSQRSGGVGGKNGGKKKKTAAVTSSSFSPVVVLEDLSSNWDQH